MTESRDVELVAINTIRTLSMDAVQAANSGHPGTPMALAPVTYTLWQRFLRFDPSDPIWPNRDRFVLSIGHASMLLYSMLHLTQVKAVNSKYERLGNPSVELDDLRNFRQLESRCPGHPEYRWTSGVETTTGPLGQGVATSAGMAIAARMMAAHFNRPDFEMFDYDVYALCGDGCMMKGVSAEAASLAGHLRLGNLCWIYDNNKITIEGADPKGLAGRTASARVLNAVAKGVPWLVGGAADLTPSTKTRLEDDGDFTPDTVGRNLHFGVREHAMGAILNGLSLSKLRPLPRPGATAGRDRARLRREGVHPGLGSLRRLEGEEHRHDDLRRVRAAGRAAEEIRVHGGERRDHGQGARACHVKNPHREAV